MSSEARGSTGARRPSSQRVEIDTVTWRDLTRIIGHLILGYRQFEAKINNSNFTYVCLSMYKIINIRIYIYIFMDPHVSLCFHVSCTLNIVIHLPHIC
jgi:hypothetical protein